MQFANWLANLPIGRLARLADWTEHIHVYQSKSPHCKTLVLERGVWEGGGGGKGYSEPSLYCTAKFIIQHHCSAEPAALVWPARFHKRQLFRIVLKCQNLGENMTQQFCIFSLLSWFNSCDSWHISILLQDYFHVRKRP